MYSFILVSHLLVYINRCGIRCMDLNWSSSENTELTLGFLQVKVVNSQSRPCQNAYSQCATIYALKFWQASLYQYWLDFSFYKHVLC